MATRPSFQKRSVDVWEADVAGCGRDIRVEFPIYDTPQNGVFFPAFDKEVAYKVVISSYISGGVTRIVTSVPNQQRGGKETCHSRLCLSDNRRITADHSRSVF